MKIMSFFLGLSTLSMDCYKKHYPMKQKLLDDLKKNYEIHILYSQQKMTQGQISNFKF